MATIAEMFVEIGADASEFDRETRRMQSSMAGVSNEMRGMARELGGSASQLGSDWRSMSNEMKQAYRDSYRALLPYKRAQREVEFGFFRMAQGMDSFRGTNRQFMAAVEDLGHRHRRATDDMIRNNQLMRASFIQSVGTMVARSSQSSKIAANFQRMGNPLYSVNRGLLSVTNGLEGIARRGQPAVMALRMLGPTANMKQLMDMTRLISTGLMRFQMIAVGAAIASGVLYTALFKVAKGPKVSEVLKKQEEALAEYRDAVRDRTKEIMESWRLFEEVQLTKTSGSKLMKNLQEQVKVMGNWKTNLSTIAKRAGSEFANYLSQMGPQSANEVSKIAQMTGPQLDKYVGLWKEKMSLSKDVAVSELEMLKAQTDKKVQELQDSLTPLGLALEPLKQAFSGAFTPMVEAFTMIMVPMVNFITKIGEMITKFNEANPKVALMIQAFLMLIPILTLILSPLAIGIGLFGGLSAAFASVWMLISPVVIGLATMMGTVLLVAAAVVVLVAAFMYAWNNINGFKEGVIGAWNAIKNAAVIAFQALLTFIQPAIEAIRAFIFEKLAQIQQYWAQNGQMILAAASNLWNLVLTVITTVANAIWAVMQFLWPVIKALVVSTWNAIMNVINGAINIILGVISFFSALFTGNWSALWAATKQILLGAVQLIWGLINLWFIGKFIGGFRAFATAGKALFSSFWTGAKTIFSTSFNAIKSGVTATANGIKSVLMAVFNALKGGITGILNAIKSVFVNSWNAMRSQGSAIANGIKSVVSTVFNAMKSAISSILRGIANIFDSTWNGIINAVRAAVNGVKSAIQNGLNAALSFVKGLGSSFMAAGKGLIDMMASGIAAAAGKVTGAVKRLAGKVRDFLPFSPAKEGPLDDLDKLDFGGPIADSLKRGEPLIKRLMGRMLTMPEIDAPSPSIATYSRAAFGSQSKQQNIYVELDGRTITQGVLPHMEREIRLKTGIRHN